MLKQFIFIVILSALLKQASAQSVSGRVFSQPESNSASAPLIGASVYWLNTTDGTTTDASGAFVINTNENSKKLVFSFIGYQSDTIEVKNPDKSIEVSLKKEVLLEVVEIEAKQKASNISTLELMNTELLTSKEFEKAACCNLSESFETNATVDVNYTDAISGARTIQMLGLDGVYSQIMFENLPFLRGLSASRGLSYIPGTWLESISITKGTGSVINGYESMTGLINLELLKPRTAPLVYVNIYGNQMGRKEANVHLAKRINDQWSSALFLHGSDLSQRNDRNDDGFLDMPLKRQINLLNRWKYTGNRLQSQFGFRVLSDENTGGQIDFNSNEDRENPSNYGVGIESKEGEFFFKNGLIFPSVPNRSIAIIGSARRSEQDYFFGMKNYEGNQNTIFLNLIYQSSFISNEHIFKVGSTYLYDDFDEQFNDSGFTRTELVPGIYGEYTYTSLNEKLSFNLGMRNDFHNLFGSIFSPRFHVKYNPHPLTSFRVSAGKGFRTANVFAENTFALASSRRVQVLEALNPEISWNTGLSITHKFKLFNKQSSLNLDYYRTEFENQVIVDLENPNELRFYNLNGISYSNSVQLDFGMELNRLWDFKMAGKFYDVQSTYDGKLKSRPLVKKLGGLVNVGYESSNKNWRVDATSVLYGTSRLPSTESNPIEYQLKSKSDTYATLSGQITRKIKTWEIYLGCENITNFKQPNAIIASDDPFGKNFDASLIWGPVAGRVIYGGVKFYITQKSKQ